MDYSTLPVRQVNAPEDLPFSLPRRPRDAHKGNFGRLLIVAGSVGFTGAPILASRAALRTGAGLVFLGVPRDIYPIAAVKCEEAMPFPLPEEDGPLLDRARGCDAVLIGPGLGQAPETRRRIQALLEQLDCPVVLDADGLNAIAPCPELLDRRPGPTVLTPHEGEFARLTGCALPVQHRLEAARRFAAAHRCTVVLKGRHTTTAAADGRAWRNGTGNPGMATGGSGDVLAGMLAALLGQPLLRAAYDLPTLAAAAVLLHGQAGDRCAQALGETAMLPGDMLETLPQVLRPLEEPS